MKNELVVPRVWINRVTKKGYPKQPQVILVSSVTGNILEQDIRLFLNKVNKKLIKQIVE